MALLWFARESAQKDFHVAIDARAHVAPAQNLDTKHAMRRAPSSSHVDTHALTDALICRWPVISIVIAQMSIVKRYRTWIL